MRDSSRDMLTPGLVLLIGPSQKAEEKNVETRRKKWKSNRMLILSIISDIFI
jgi:hypothetical protein